MLERKTKMALLALVVPVLGACGGGSPSRPAPAATRVITGTVAVRTGARLFTRIQAINVRTRAVIATVTPSATGAFSLTIPTGTYVNVSATAGGRIVPITFPRPSTVTPSAKTNIARVGILRCWAGARCTDGPLDLGTLVDTGEDLNPQDGMHSPAMQEDFDEDGIPDGMDMDVDGDGMPNDMDMDNDNDGMMDRAQLHDADGDGLTNDADPDIDGDGIPNSLDTDDDGNGVPDAMEPDVDGDGIPNAMDDDIDGDGIPNAMDADANGDGDSDNPMDNDGDGIPNAMDDDIDGDGVPNAMDPDIDGDGVPNAMDTDANNDGMPDG